MKILLVAVNAKFIHMNPALYSIRAFAASPSVEVAEYTINQFPKDVLMDIFEKRPDVIGFSCYIWNMTFIKELLSDVKKVLPSAQVYLGGPEVSYNKEQVLAEFPQADGIFFGEGERPWKSFIRQMLSDGCISHTPEGLLLRADIRNASSVPKGLQTGPDGKNQGAGPAESAKDIIISDNNNLINLDDIPFIYDDLSLFENRILYYETSRGCPYRCSYCLSSIDKMLRFRSLEKVYSELQFFLDHKVSIVKFIDRTFNAGHDHSLSIWKYLKEHDNGITRFHFEIEADILTEEEIQFLKTVRKGLFQFEIGVQSTNEKTLHEINRFAKIERIKRAVLELKAAGNIPLHVDLIAGLPYEDLESFKASFNEVYSWNADELQLGFLKVLHGTEMERKVSEYGLIYEENPPYEVISNKWISFDDVVFLKKIEDQLERYGNSNAFAHTLKAFERLFDTPFEMFEFIASYFAEHALKFRKQSRASSYEMLKGAIGEKIKEKYRFYIDGKESDFLNIKDVLPEAEAELERKAFDAMIIWDLYEKEKLKTRPDFLGDRGEQRRREKEYLKENPAAGKEAHVEFMDFNVELFEKTGEIRAADCKMIFTYQNQTPIGCVFDADKKLENDDLIRIYRLDENAKAIKLATVKNADGE